MIQEIGVNAVTTLLPLPSSFERMYLAVEKVKERLAKAVTALETASIPYAVIGGNAVANYVIRVDPGAERFTKDVDLIIRRSDLEAAKAAMAKYGFEYHHVWGVDSFIEPGGKASEAVHLLFAGEKVKPDSSTTIPNVEDAESGPPYCVISLSALVGMKLEGNRRKDQTHIVDLMNCGLIDESWIDRYPSPLRERLLEILSDPNEQRGI